MAKHIKLGIFATVTQETICLKICFIKNFQKKFAQVKELCQTVSVCFAKDLNRVFCFQP